MSWLFSRVLVEEYSGESSLGGEPFAQLNVMPTQQPFLLNDKTTAFSTHSQFGLTCRPLTVHYGVTLLTLYLVDFPARTSAQPGEVPVSKVSDPACGWKWPASSVKYSPSSRSWKTRQCSLLGGLEEFSETWPRWGSMLDGECSALPTPARRTNESASGSWPTIRSSDGERGGRGDLIQAVRGNPNSHYKTWPTPHGFSKDGKSNGPSGNELGRAVNREQWPTPTTMDHIVRKGMRPSRAATGRTTGYLSEALPGGSLNPPWVEWLMGWPIGWTDCAAWGTDKFQRWRLWPGGH
jgi:hypothetical protein